VQRLGEAVAVTVASLVAVDCVESPGIVAVAGSIGWSGPKGVPASGDDDGSVES
jgi:hypothetical protein